MMSTGHLLMGVAVLCMLACTSEPMFLEQPRAIPPQPGLLLEASFSKGIASEMWGLTIMPNGRVSLEVSYNDLTPAPGDLLGAFLLHPSELEAIRHVIEEQAFLELPEKLLPPLLYEHPPLLRLEVNVSGKTHRVDVTDPDQISTSAELARFLAVWNAVFERMPTRPTW